MATKYNAAQFRQTEFRNVKRGELYIDEATGEVRTWQQSYPTIHAHQIVVKKQAASRPRTTRRRNSGSWNTDRSTGSSSFTWGSEKRKKPIKRGLEDGDKFYYLEFNTTTNKFAVENDFYDEFNDDHKKMKRSGNFYLTAADARDAKSMRNA